MDAGWVALAGAIVLTASNDDPEVFTLYRTSPLESMRIHVATFDAVGEHPDYNHGNCEMVVRVLEQQPGVPKGYYWCEPGRYHAN